MIGFDGTKKEQGLMKISIAGTGKIVGEVLEMLNREFAGQIEVTGIYAREQSVEHAIDLCMAYAPTGFVYTDYGRMLQEAEADYVYIANANHVHHEYALQAMQAGHNVLVEKPITVTRVEMEQLIDCSQQRCVYCLPAFSLLYNPLFRKLQEVVPTLGTPRMVTAHYAQRSSRYDRYLQGEVTPVFDPQMAGGSLMDLNVYNLCFCIGLFGPPRTVAYTPNRGFNGIDLSGILTCHYPGSVAALSASKDSDGLSHGCIQCEKGWIDIPGSVSVMREFTVHRPDAEPEHICLEEEHHRLWWEFEEARRLVEDRQDCHITVPYVTRVAQEIAIALERMTII